MLTEQRARIRRLFLLLLLAIATAVSFIEDTNEPQPMERAWEVLQKRDWAIENHTESPHKAQLCADNSGLPLRGAKAPLILPTRSHLILTFPQCPPSNLPQVTVLLGGNTLLCATWMPRTSVPTLEVTIPDAIDAEELKVVGAGKVLWRRFVYITFALPLSPQVPAWRGVLDDACRWAHGARTPDEIASHLAHGLFASGRFIYPVSDPTKGASYVQHNTFALHRFLTHQGPSFGNCVDLSDYLAICAAALGVPLRLLQLSDSQDRELVTNPICPVGWDVSDPESYQSLRCSMHQVAYLASDEKFYDACFFCAPATRRQTTPSFGWELSQLQQYWQPESGTPGLIRRPHDSTPEARLSNHLPRVQ